MLTWDMGCSPHHVGNGSETGTALLQHPTGLSWGVVFFFLLRIYKNTFFFFPIITWLLFVTHFPK